MLFFFFLAFFVFLLVRLTDWLGPALSHIRLERPLRHLPPRANPHCERARGMVTYRLTAAAQMLIPYLTQECIDAAYAGEEDYRQRVYTVGGYLNVPHPAMPHALTSQY